jgi:predicted transcriptional regulator
MKSEVLAKQMKRKRPRSRERLMMEILETIEKKKDIKRTNIANTVQINYLLAVELTDKLQKELMITRSGDGIYQVTQPGWEFLYTMKKIFGEEGLR